MIVRLLRAGLRRKDGRFATGVLHLWHKKADRSRLPDNDRLLDEALAGDWVRARQGISTLAAEDAGARSA